MTQKLHGIFTTRQGAFSNFFPHRTILKSLAVSLDALPKVGRSPGPGDPRGEAETREVKRTWYRSMHGPKTLACLVALRCDLSGSTSPSEYVLKDLRICGVGLRLADACPCRGMEDTERALYARAGYQVNQHQSLIHAMSRVFQTA